MACRAGGTVSGEPRVAESGTEPRGNALAADVRAVSDGPSGTVDCRRDPGSTRRETCRPASDGLVAGGETVG